MDLMEDRKRDLMEYGGIKDGLMNAAEKKGKKREKRKRKEKEKRSFHQQ